MRRFSTILTGSLLALTLSGCAVMPADPAAQVPTPQVSEPSSPAQPSAEGEGTGEGTDSSESNITEPTLIVTWDGDSPAEPIGGGLEVSAPSASGLAIALTGRDDLTTRIQLDQSVAVFLGEEFVLGLSAPKSPEAPTNAWSWERTSQAEHIVFTATRRSNLEEDTDISVLLGETAVESADWVNEPEGPRLFITPSLWAREGGLAVSDFGWHSVVRDAPEVTEYAGASLEHQFQCHAVGARSKETWNLETWYDDIGLLSFLAARCNP